MAAMVISEGKQFPDHYLVLPLFSSSCSVLVLLLLLLLLFFFFSPPSPVFLNVMFLLRFSKT